MRNVSRFRLRAHTLSVGSSIWRGGNGHCDKRSCAAVQNEVHVLFHCQDLFVCSLRRKYSFHFFLPILFYGGPFYSTCLVVRLSLIFFLNGTIDSAISFRTLWTIFWLAKTSNKPISLTTWLAIKPLTLASLTRTFQTQTLVTISMSSCSSNHITKSPTSSEFAINASGTAIVCKMRSKSSLTAQDPRFSRFAHQAYQALLQWHYHLFHTLYWLK